MNVTETTDQAGAPSLITGVQVEGATAADNAFYEEAVAKSEALRIPYPGAGAKYKWRYFLPKQLESMRSRKRMNDIPQEEKNKRNNVEATIFQLCFHTRNNKTRYRGKRKHELWALARCAWINLRRLVIFEAGMTPKGTTSGQNGFSFAISAIQKTMSQTFAHLIFCFTTQSLPAIGRGLSEILTF